MEERMGHLIKITLANITNESQITEEGILSAMISAVEKERDMGNQLMKDRLLGNGLKFDAFCSVLSPMVYDRFNS